VFPEVTVIMGDPRLPDTVKKGGVFNPEDHATIDELREALAAIDGYRFAYMDNHASLIQELRARPPAFVLNLCDEGYDNDAFKELHVPALLEMLGVPYTGAGPVCLGLCYDKALVRAIAVQLDIPVPLETYFDPADQAATLPSIFPALIKPATGDSSIGITKDAVVHDAGQAVAYLRELRQLLPGRAALVQEFLSGAEYSVGLIGNPGTGLRALPVLEVDYSQLDRGRRGSVIPPAGPTSARYTPRMLSVASLKTTWWACPWTRPPCRRPSPTAGRPTPRRRWASGTCPPNTTAPKTTRTWPASGTRSSSPSRTTSCVASGRWSIDRKGSSSSRAPPARERRRHSTR